jgi:DNA (cytosine-5)-methyltransferase 1
LAAALRLQAGLDSPAATKLAEVFTSDTGDCLNPWDTQQARIFTPESRAPTLASADGGGGRNPAGLLFSAGFCAGAGPSAGGIGYMEECSPTLKAAESIGVPTRAQRSGSCGERRSSEMSELSPSGGSEGYGACDDAMVPSVLCLNDQGGSAMHCTENVSGTLRAQEHGHQPLVFENHGVDARYTGPHRVSPTLSCRAGTGGNNLPLTLQEQTGFYSRQRSDKFTCSDVVSTQSARQSKDATDLVCQSVNFPLLIRRFTPTEAERLQGYPDDWTALPKASDSARYRALGNSVAIPCVEHLIGKIVQVLHLSGDSTSILSHDR